MQLIMLMIKVSSIVERCSTLNMLNICLCGRKIWPVLNICIHDIYYEHHQMIMIVNNKLDK